MTQPLRLGLAGLGTVGAGVAKMIAENAALIARRAGRPVTLAAVCARSRTRERGVDLSQADWEDDPVALATRADVDVFVELMGGEDGPALAATRAAIAAGKHVVTANKAMLAIHGQELAEAAEAAGVSLRFEAAVAGGIPVIKVLTESLAGNRIERLMGVMNGTCNYILTRMEDAGLSYEEAFAEADDLGYLEADPELDVGGIDAAHKLSLLASIAFGTQVDFEGVQRQGIGAVSIEDIRDAGELGYRIKLLGVARRTEAGLEQSMMPCLVSRRSPLGQLEGGTNMVVIEGDFVGQIVLRGAGAGEGPTASAVVGDIVDIARGIQVPTFGTPARELVKAVSVPPGALSPWYVRMSLIDKPGVLARVAGILGEAGVSIDRLRQKGHETDTAPVVLVTHPVEAARITEALTRIAESAESTEPPVAFRIVDA